MCVCDCVSRWLWVRVAVEGKERRRKGEAEGRNGLIFSRALFAVVPLLHTSPSGWDRCSPIVSRYSVLSMVPAHALCPPRGEGSGEERGREEESGGQLPF